MKQLVYNVNTTTGIVSLADQQKKVNLFEYENNAVNLIFNYDSNISEHDKLVILFVNNKGSMPYSMLRKSNTQYSVVIPRPALVKGLLGFTIQHYRSGYSECIKYVLDNYLVVNEAEDVTESIVDNKPDLVAEIFFRLENLEKKG